MVSELHPYLYREHFYISMRHRDILNYLQEFLLPPQERRMPTPNSLDFPTRSLNLREHFLRLTDQHVIRAEQVRDRHIEIKTYLSHISGCLIGRLGNKQGIPMFSLLEREVVVEYRSGVVGVEEPVLYDVKISLYYIRTSVANKDPRLIEYLGRLSNNLP